MACPPFLPPHTTVLLLLLLLLQLGTLLAPGQGKPRRGEGTGKGAGGSRRESTGRASRSIELDNDGSLFEDLDQRLKAGVCQIKGLEELALSDCFLDAPTVEKLNSRYFKKILDQLAEEDYFAIFKVDLETTCPFPALRDEQGMCSIRECAVNECAEEDVPLCFRQEDKMCEDEEGQEEKGRDTTRDIASVQMAKGLDPLGFSVSDKYEDDLWIDLGGGKGIDKMPSFLKGELGGGGEGGNRIPDHPDHTISPQYVDMRQNPEGYTGYEGEHANAIWASIYEGNCFAFGQDLHRTLSVSPFTTTRSSSSPSSPPEPLTTDIQMQCTEARVFYRIISGIQASITTHIAARYLFRRERVAPPLPVPPVRFFSPSYYASLVREIVFGSKISPEMGLDTVEDYSHDNIATYLHHLLQRGFTSLDRLRFATAFLRHRLHLILYQRRYAQEDLDHETGTRGEDSETDFNPIRWVYSARNVWAKVERDGAYWGINLPLYASRVGQHEDYLENLLFTYLFVLRAARKASTYLTTRHNYSTGEEGAHDRIVATLRRMLGKDEGGDGLRGAEARLLLMSGFSEEEIGMFRVSSEEVLEDSRCPSFFPVKEGEADAGESVPMSLDLKLHYDEGGADGELIAMELTGVEDGRAIDSIGEEGENSHVAWLDRVFDAFERRRDAKLALRQEFRQRFRNISRVLNCIGCSKCRLWGKLQVLGVGTALKIVLEDQENCALEQSGNTREAMEGVRHGDPRWSPLQRNEVIALINVLHRLSISVSHVQRLRQVEMDTAIVHFVGTGLGLFVVTTVAWFLWCMCGRRGRGETRNQSRRLVLEKKKN